LVRSKLKTTFLVGLGGVLPQLILVLPQLILVLPKLILVLPQLNLVLPQLFLVLPQLIRWVVGEFENNTKLSSISIEIASCS
jgi:hypothetical protein